ncbi:MAG TPA: anthrone oxygenase family protein [Mycobacteriales bacterium]|nr:anthrone oxygenase family protein [Mycobacteriales bacterium]
MTQILLSLALLTSGPAAGVLIGSATGPVLMLRSLPPSRYVEMHRLLARRPEPFQPICFVTATICDLALAVTVRNAGTSLLFLLAATCGAGVIMVSKARSNPLKRFATSFDPENLPDEWAQIDPRPRWARWNLARTALATAALVANVCAVVMI